ECAPGTLSAPPHVHSAEEELFVVLDGSGTLELWPDETHPVRVGSVVARPPGAQVAHAFRGGEDGLTLLAWGTREPNDICWYPRSKKLFWRGLGALAAAALTMLHFIHSGWPLASADPLLVVAAGILFLFAYAFKAWGWQRLFPEGQRPQALTLAAAGGAASVGGVALPGRFDEAIRIAVVRRLPGKTKTAG